MTCFAFWINYSWYKHCNKINDDWSAICKKLIGGEENESKN